jgi:hypothetical protein
VSSRLALPFVPPVVVAAASAVRTTRVAGPLRASNRNPRMVWFPSSDIVCAGTWRAQTAAKKALSDSHFHSLLFPDQILMGGGV